MSWASSPKILRLRALLGLGLVSVVNVVKILRNRLRISNFTICLMGTLMGLGLGLILLRGFIFAPGIATYWDLTWWYSSHTYPLHYMWDEFIQAPVVVNHSLGYLLVSLFSPETAERLFYLLIFTIMGLSMFFTTFKLTAPRHASARVPLIASTLATLLFVINPVLCTRIWHLEVLWFYAFLPLLVYFSYSAFRDIHFLQIRGFIKRAVLLALVLFAMSVSARIPIYIPLLFMGFFACFSRPVREYLTRSALLIGLTLILYAALSSVWIIPTFLSSSYTPYWYVNTRGYLYLSSWPMFEGFTLQIVDVRDFFTHIFFHSHSSFLTTLWKASCIAIPIIAFSSILLHRSKLVIWLGLFAVAFIFLGKGVNPPWGNFYEWLVFDSPVVSSFGYQLRKTGMWQLPLMVCYAMLAGLTISYVLGFIKDRIKWPKLRKGLFAFFIIIMLSIPLGSGYPLLTGDVNGTMKPESGVSNWTYLNAWLKDEAEEGKVMGYPYDHLWWGLAKPRPPWYYAGTRPSRSLLYPKFIRGSVIDTLRMGELLSAFNGRYMLTEVPSASAVFVKQEDMEFAQRFGRIEVFENKADPRQIAASNRSVVVLGGLENMLSLTSIDSYNLKDVPAVFLDQLVTSSDYIPPADIFVSSLDNLDLYMTILEEEYMVEPAAAVDRDRRTKWQQGPIHYLNYYVVAAGQTNWQHDYWKNTVYTSGHALLNVSFAVSEPGNYDILVRYLRSGAGSTGISVSLDGELLRSVTTESLITAAVWNDLGRYHLEEGKHTLMLANTKGFNAVNLFAILPQGELERYEQQINEWMADKRIVYIWEAESALNFSQAEVTRKYSLNASKGEVLNLSAGSHVWRTIDILRDDDYRLGIRLNGSAVVSIGGESFTVHSPRLNLTYLDPMYLDRGKHSLKIDTDGEQNCDLDVVWLYSVDDDKETIEDIFAVRQNAARVVEYTKVDPTKYRVTVIASQPFMLEFAETYDRLWTATVNGKEYPTVMLNAMANGFWIEDEGELEITIEFKSQRWFYYGATISGIALAGILAFLLWNWRRNKKDARG